MGRNIIFLICLTLFAGSAVKPRPVELEDRQNIVDLRFKAILTLVEIKDAERKIAEAEKLRNASQLELEHKQIELDRLNVDIEREVTKLKDKYKSKDDWELTDKFEWTPKVKK